MTISIIDNILRLELSPELYNEDILFKCFYWYTGRYPLTIDKGYEYFIVQIEMPSNENSDILVAKIKRDLIDFKLRDIVTKETQTIRELLIAKAFAYDDFPDNPSSGISDPVGFNPLAL